jgi:hypothetical protein
MSSISTFVDCNGLQDSLDNVWGINNQQLGNVNILRFILNPINSQYLKTKINFRAHGRRDVEAIFGQRFLESQVTDSGRLLCTTGITDGTTSQPYSIDPDNGVQMTISFTAQELETMCMSDKDFLTNEVKKVMDVLVRRMETKAATFITTNTGNFADYVIQGDPAADTAKTGKTFTSGGTILTDMLFQIDYNTMANESQEKPWVFGGSEWQRYFTALNAACCGDLGVDAGVYQASNGSKFVYSDRVQMQTDENTGIAIVPGAIQMISFNEFMGESGNILFMNDDALKQTVLLYPDPTIPLYFDYRAEYKCADGETERKWHFTLGLIHEFIGLPTNMYQTGDQLEGVTYINEYVINNA